MHPSPSLDVAALEAARDNFTVAESDHRHFARCWAHQTCGGCLDETKCSWCPYTWSCVPNSYMIPLLAPAYQADICPHPAERWELRSQPFGCGVSSTTSLTAFVSIAATLAVAVFVLLNAVAVMRWRRYTKQTPHWRDGWGQRWRKALAPARDQERAPLLSNAEGVPAGHGSP
ncbi:plexin repeat domain-containing protein [Purpureocillium lilacinum]|uniref:Plexin repeat domain-containing protein n=1 Tax=Purpureocillium lilacinum TaxID=33203 RepID=A0A179HMT4_PURLI|nr:plexin repeat domain-containing protein [Purpureocillium lilacinum]OAQ81573.1 plexin repeat domain-containing protein [Purpureocillium lilacinum]OAQ91627.1 plexin repeat domain-containing protein [Purpureocillium lilacinum]GJN72977.1 hypothetical protein PLICBS_007053 [Purpureocillium lilacinum]